MEVIEGGGSAPAAPHPAERQEEAPTVARRSLRVCRRYPQEGSTESPCSQAAQNVRTWAGRLG